MRPRKIEERLKGLNSSGKKAVAWLIDPDKVKSTESLKNQIKEAIRLDLDFFFVGGSLIQENSIDSIVGLIKSLTTEIPVVIFPGNVIQFSEKADGLLFLSLISGRNPEFLIGQHVTIAPLLMKTKVEILPTGYLLIDSGAPTSVQYISQTIPLPNTKPDLSVATAFAGHLLGLQYFYVDAGSGAKNPVSSKIIHALKKHIPAPLIVGGGLNSLPKVKEAFTSGADLVVIGNGAEKNPGFLTEVLEYIAVFNLSLNVN
ncbi:hypothetical protein P872_03325 [Rhodonellum psychrophilum GCM71 = DSM 17998]|uniref:Geranylgeranylglyceryl phosphate synthase n=2 Tax=Rhodonellum TaxID=336827 RepID=U5C026_9BACT|nr:MULTISPECIES: geranylgeranylglyceryl/heptaprenylglyceryl phosphate synthase [Rhodonellum]ERM83423.1 hypothetical protein P872_03325 [Rhodonellum psychrophilum GCM71 = DSM 17998]SDY44980.1 putative glycerol-1-phosphate prenyltransferase [Rhodonellum ikkaensis]